MKISSVISIIFIIFVTIEGYAENDAGSSRASFTRGGWAGARYMAMGKAAEVIVDDVFAIYWNPAGLRELLNKETLSQEEIKKRASTGDVNTITEKDLTLFSEEQYSKNIVEIGLSSAILAVEREAGFAGVAFNFFNGVLGLGYYGIQSRDIESRDTEGNYQKDLNYIASVGYISYGWGIGVASVGLSFKMLHEKIGDVEYYGMGSDIGTQIELIPLVKIGFVVQDIGTGLKPTKKYDNIENKYDFAYPVFKLSASLTNRASDLIVAISGIKKLEQEKFEVNLGLQYNILKYSSIYLGLNNSLFSTGVSLKLFNTDITYAFSFDKIDFGYNNMLSLTLVI